MKRNVSLVRSLGVPAALWLIVVLMLAQSLAAQIGATYYVSTSGSDNNPGTRPCPG